MMALTYPMLYLSYTGGGHCRLRASHCPTPLLSCCPPLHWVLGVRPSPLFVSSTTRLPHVGRPPLLLHPPPPNRLTSSTPHSRCNLLHPIASHHPPPPLVASSAAQSPCIVRHPLIFPFALASTLSIAAPTVPTTAIVASI
jgi:hypothetical protein